jgi:hypothetical protein
MIFTEMEAWKGVRTGCSSGAAQLLKLRSTPAAGIKLLYPDNPHHTNHAWHAGPSTTEDEG